MTYEEIRDLIGQVLALDEQATAGPWDQAWPTCVTTGGTQGDTIADGCEEEDAKLIATYRTAAPTLARELQRLLAEHADGAWVFAADLRRALEGKDAVGNDPLVLEVQNLRTAYADALADADASQHWRTRALRAEEALEEARAALRLATEPTPDDLLGVRLVNGCAGLPDDTPAWVADLFREAWAAIRVLRRDAEGKAARIARLDEDLDGSEDTLRCALDRASKAKEEIERLRTRLDVMETERNEARDERDALAEQIAAIGTWIDARTDAPRTDDSGQPLTLVQRLNATRAELVRVREERDELQRVLWAEQGDPRGAPDPAWTWVGDGWGREYPNGERAEVHRGQWYRGFSGHRSHSARPAQTMRAGMIACDQATP